MLVNKAIAQIMKENKITQKQMATMIGKKSPNEISARLNYPNMSIDKIVEMLSVMGYEIIIQKTTAGVRAKDQIVLEHSKTEEIDLDAILSAEGN